VITGPDPGHVFPAVALCLRLRAAGDEPVLLTGTRWLQRVREEGLECAELPGLAAAPTDDDTDAGARLHARAARMSTDLLPVLRELDPDLVVADVLTAGGGLAAERASLPWVEVSPHPLYLPSRGLPPIGSGLAPGRGPLGPLRDGVLRRLAARSQKLGREHRRSARLSVGLPAHDPGPLTRLIATLPALEVPRPDWPEHAHVVGPLLWDPVTTALAAPAGTDPLVLVSPSTAVGGALGVLDAALGGLSGVRVVATTLPDTSAGCVGAIPNWAAVGVGRQDELLAQARVVVCGGGHGILVKALLAGVPAVVVPGGGDQRELAGRVARHGSALVVRPLPARPRPRRCRAPRARRAVLRRGRWPGGRVGGAAAGRAGAAVPRRSPLSAQRSALTIAPQPVDPDRDGAEQHCDDEDRPQRSLQDGEFGTVHVRQAIPTEVRPSGLLRWARAPHPVSRPGPRRVRPGPR